MKETLQYHLKGIEATFQALSKGRFLIYLLPGVIITLFYLIYTYGYASGDGFLGVQTGIGFIDWIMEFFEGVLTFMIEQFYLFIMLTALSPFFTRLGEQFDETLTGTTFTTSFGRIILDILRMMLVVMIMLICEYMLILIYWTITLPFDIPYFDAIVYSIITAFFFGFAFYDFALERYKKGVFSTVGYAFSNISTMILTGGIFLLIYKIPIVGVPLAPVITIMISTVVYLYKEKKLPKHEN